MKCFSKLETKLKKLKNDKYSQKSGTLILSILTLIHSAEDDNTTTKTATKASNCVFLTRVFTQRVQRIGFYRFCKLYIDQSIVTSLFHSSESRQVV